MASSRIEIASSRYGFVLRDHNQRIKDRERNIERTQATLCKNRDEFAREGLSTCIAVPKQRDAEIVSTDENSKPMFSNRLFRDRNNNNNNSRSSVRNFRSESGEGDSSSSSNNNNNPETETASNEFQRTLTMQKQSRILDGRPSRQTRDMKRQTKEAEPLALSSSESVSVMASSIVRDNSPTTSDSSSELPSLRASSLLKMWRGIEAESSVPTRNLFRRGISNSNPVVSRSSSSDSSTNNSPISNIEDCSDIEDTLVRSEVCESSGQIDKPISVMEDSNDESYGDVTVFPDWDSDRTSASEPHLLLQRQSSDVGESEKGRVADIIRRLTSASQPQSPVANLNDETDREHWIKSPFQSHRTIDHGNIPVKGRQVIKDLLKEREKERQKELHGLVDRHAVSRFSQRGRLQSLLRLKVLQREVAAQEQHRPTSAPSELDQLQQRPTILHLRERFNSGVEQNSLGVFSREDNSRSPRPLRTNKQDSEQSVILKRDSPHQAVSVANTIEPTSPLPLEQHTILSKIEPHELEEETQSAGVTSEGPAKLDLLSQGNAEESSHRSEEDSDAPRHELVEKADDETLRHGECIDGWEGTSSGVGILDWEQPMETTECSNGLEEDGVTLEEDLGNGHLVGSIGSWQPVSVTEESDQNTLRLVESDNGNWLGNTPRSESDFEGRRQAWYHNMLESNLDNDEIRELFERRSVSTFLTSDLRARMDQMVGSFLRRQGHLVTTIAEGENEDEEEGSINHQYNERRSESHYQDNEVSDEYDPVASTSLQQPETSNSYGEDSPQSSPFMRHNSLEMELIYDLKGHMQQLSQEMSELRKSIRSCIGMQVKLQNSIQKEVSSPVGHSRGEMKMESFTRQPARICSICHEMQVDSLLYRCGHMCTCFNCAHELQWNSGRCPICRAPIIDIVRAYPDSTRCSEPVVAYSDSYEYK